MAFTSGNDINILQGTDLATVGAGAGNDRYVLTAATLTANQKITISDTLGINTLQLAGGLEIVSSKVTADAIQLTLNNGAVITVLGASTFSFQTGGDSLAGTGGVVQNYSDFVTLSLGLAAVPAAGAAPVDVGSVTVNAAGGTTVTGTQPTYALAEAAATVDEGATATFNMTTTNVAEGTEVAYTLTGINAADLASGALTGKATVGADGKATISVALAADATTEGPETLTVTLDGPAISASSTVNDTSAGPTFSLTASADSVNEGVSNTFTVTASQAVAANTTVTFQLKIDGTGDTAQLADFNAGSFNPVVATILAGATTATFDIATITNDGTELSEKYSVEATVGSTVLTKQVSILDGSLGAGQSFTLTTGFDQIPGLNGSNGNTVTSGNDTITGILTNAADETMNATDVIDAGEGTDTLNVILGANIAGTDLPTFSNVDTLKFTGTAGSVGTAGINDLVNDGINDNDATVSTVVDLSTRSITTLDVASAAGMSVKLAATTDATIAGVTGNIEVNGGKTVTVNDATANNNITVGSTVAAVADDTNTVGTAAAGAITVTDTKQGTGQIQVDGGTTASVTSTVSATTAAVAGGDIVIGALKSASGAVTVVQNLTATGGDADGDDLTAANIDITGGSTVAVTVNATNTATAAGADGDIVIGTVAVTGDGKTTTVTVNQNATVTEFTTPLVAEVAETSTVTFSAMTAGETLTLTAGNSLTFTAAKALTAAEVASAFAGLVASDRQTSTGPVVNGIYSGQFSAEWTSAAASGAVVVFTGIDDSVTDLTFGGTATAPAQVKAAGTAESGDVDTTNTITYGAVAIDDNAAEAITTVTLNGYASADLGKAGGDLDALTTLSLTNSSGAAEVATDSTALALTVNDVLHNVELDETLATIESLTITATGANSAFLLEAAAVTDLTINAAVALDLSTSTMSTVFETVDVNGAGAVDLGDISAAVTLNTFDASGSTGGVTATVETGDTDLTGTITEYVFSAGADTADLLATTGTVMQTKVTLGAGNDTADLSNGDIATLSEMIDGGADTDTLKLTAAVAETASASATFEANITSFERLTIAAATGLEVVDLANLDDISYVTLGSSTGTAQVITLTDAAAKNAGVTKYQAGDEITVTVNGAKVVYTIVAGDVAADDTVLNVHVRDAINNDATLGALVTAVATSKDVITLTADVAGMPITASMVITKDFGSDGVDTITAATTTPNAEAITLDNMASGGTVVLTATGAVVVNVKDATTGLTDVLNVLTTSNNDTNYGALTADKVETINITVDDTDNNNGVGADTETLALFADGVKAITVGNASDTVTVNSVSYPDITNLTLTITDATALATVNASGMKGVFTYTASNGTTTVTGGEGADVLTGSGLNDVLLGGAGNDTLTGASKTTLTGGAGVDTFIMTSGLANINSYSIITDFLSGDKLDTSGTSFEASGVDLQSTAVFDSFVNAAIADTDTGDVTWFQKDGNTYVVQNVSNSTSFDSSVDFIIQFTGLKDLSTASFNSTTGTLEMA